MILQVSFLDSYANTSQHQPRLVSRRKLKVPELAIQCEKRLILKVEFVSVVYASFTAVAVQRSEHHIAFSVKYEYFMLCLSTFEAKYAGGMPTGL